MHEKPANFNDPSSGIGRHCARELGEVFVLDNCWCRKSTLDLGSESKLRSTQDCAFTGMALDVSGGCASERSRACSGLVWLDCSFPMCESAACIRTSTAFTIRISTQQLRVRESEARNRVGRARGVDCESWPLLSVGAGYTLGVHRAFRVRKSMYVHVRGSCEF